jgi:predicted GH43/DUF377 family glycosyl hydrolase
MRKNRKAVFILIIVAAMIFPKALFSKSNPENNRDINFRDRLLPALLDGGFKMDGYWVWCGSVIKGEDGKYHMFASRWPKGLPFSPHWLTNSEIVRAVSDKPAGPYKFAEVVFPPRGERYWDGKMTHNPTICKSGDTYLLYYIGTTYHGDMPTPENPTTENSPLKLEAHQHERVGLATSKSVYGPWQRRDKPIIDVRPNSWEQYLISNPAPIVMPDGRIYLFYKGVERLKKHAIGLATAKSYKGPYKRVFDKPFDLGVDAEDPTIWFENGKYRMLLLDWAHKYSDKEIFSIVSDDLFHWRVQPNPLAISKNILWEDGKYRKMSSTERPQVLIENGKAIYVFFATGQTVNGEKSTWCMSIPLKSEDEIKDPCAAPR